MTHILRSSHLPLDASALAALRHVCAQTDTAVEDTIRSKVLPQWSKLDALAKEVIVLHAMNTTDATWNMILGRLRGEYTDAFKLSLALLCEKHLEAQITDEDFTASANSTFDRLAGRPHRA